MDTPTQEPITLVKDQHIVGDFLAHFEYTFHFRSHACTPTFACQDPKVVNVTDTAWQPPLQKWRKTTSMPILAFAFGGDQVLTM